MTYGTPEQVAVSLGRPADSITATELAQWQMWLDQVEAAITRRFVRLGLELAVQVAAGTPTGAAVALVEVAAVVRKVHNPDGLTSTTVSIDDGSITKRRDGYRGGDPLLLTAEEWDSLLPTPDPAAWSTRPGFVPDTGGWLL